jgi:hypothetical protein
VPNAAETTDIESVQIFLSTMLLTAVIGRPSVAA